MKKRLFPVLLALVMLSAFFTPAVTAAAEEVPEEPDDLCFLILDNQLTRMNYGDSDTRTEIAVGDTVNVLYNGTVPADVYVDGAPVFRFIPDEADFYCFTVRETGEVEVEVRQEETVILSRKLTIIRSAEMYRKCLKDIFHIIEIGDLRDLPGEIAEGAQQGFPVGNPFLIPATMVMLLVNVCIILFSFTRIIR